MPANSHDPPIGERWWGEFERLRLGRVAGRTRAAGWRWKIATGGEVWLWLNREGSGLIWGERDRVVMKPGMYALTGGGEPGEWTCVRYPGSHLMELVVFPRVWLEGRAAGNAGWLTPRVAALLDGGGPVGFCGLMGAPEQELCDELSTLRRTMTPSDFAA